MRSCFALRLPRAGPVGHAGRRMLNYIWLAFLLISVVVGGLTGKLPEMTKGVFETASDAVMKIALPLIGIMAIWLGIMRLAERSGLVQLIARALRPLMRVLFPEVPADHPAMGAMVMNMAANMLGLGNAATPLGLRAMTLLEKLNPRPGTATNAMCTFLAINTASIQLVPTTAMAILAVNHSSDPTVIVVPAILSTCVAACSGVVAAKILERLPWFRFDSTPSTLPQASQKADQEEKAPEQTSVEEVNVPPLSPFRVTALLAFILFFVGMLGWMVWKAPTPEMLGKPGYLQWLLGISMLAVPFLLSFFPLYAALRGVKVYEQFVEGAKEAFGVGQRIIPFLVAMLIAVRMLREAGVIALLTQALTPVLSFLRFPAELLPMVMMRPLSGSGTQGLFVELVQHLGADNLVSKMAATIYGSTETTFYVIAVYFGSVAVRKTRHAVIAGLTADTVAVIASITICRLFLT